MVSRDLPSVLIQSCGERFGRLVLMAFRFTGGITPSTIPNVLSQTPAPLSSGGYRSLDGLAVVSAIAASTEPESAARELREMFDRKPAYPPRSLQAEDLAVDKVVEQAVELLRILKDGEKTPLVHHITVSRPFQPPEPKSPETDPCVQNFVVMNDTANLTLAFGASPIMSASPDEAPHLSQLISCLLLNLGTITEVQLNAQKIAGAAANRNGKPVVFDPVGVGATEYRKKSASGASRPSGPGCGRFLQTEDARDLVPGRCWPKDMHAHSAFPQTS